MIITCENCSGKFNLKDDLVKPTGSKVRCSKCKHIFVVYPPEEESPAPPVEAVEIDIPDTDASDELKLDLSSDEDKQDEDLSLDLSFDTDDDEEDEPSSEDTSELEMDPELNFSDIQRSIEKDMENAPPEEDTEGDLDLELELDLSDDEPKTGTSQESGDEELDFSEISNILNEEPMPDSEGNDDNLEMDLELELDLGGDDQEEAPAGKASDQKDDLDFSELEKMLESDSIDDDMPSDEDMDLDLELAPSMEPEDISDSVEMSDDEDLDFSEIEDMLDTDEEDDEDEESDEFELEIEEDMESETETSGSVEDDDFDFTIEEETEDEAAGEEGAEENLVDDIMESEKISDDIPITQDEEDTIKPEKKKSKAPLVFLLFILILAGGAAAAYFTLGIDINTIINTFKKPPETPQQIDPGNLKITSHDIRSKFIENTQSGRLFIITGNIKNGYNTQRSHVKLSGKLYKTPENDTATKSLAQTEIVFAGNVLSEIDLARIPIEEIKQKLKKPAGDNNLNMGIKPMDSIPFMLVFSNLPDDLAEFTIEVLGSKNQ